MRFAKWLTNKPHHLFYYSSDENLILRDYLALERTKLANLRTFMMFLKFSLYFVIAAITILKIDEFESLSLLGYIFLACGLFMLIIGLVRYNKLKKALDSIYLMKNKKKKE